MGGKRKRKIGLTTKLFVAVFSVYAAFTLVSLQVGISAKRQEQAALSAQLETQQVRNAELESVIGNAPDESYIAKLARENLGYITPGEIVFVDISSK